MLRICWAQVSILFNFKLALGQRWLIKAGSINLITKYWLWLYRHPIQTYLKTKGCNLELSFLMAIRICQFYKPDLHEFISMLSDEELKRSNFSVIKPQKKAK